MGVRRVWEFLKPSFAGRIGLFTTVAILLVSLTVTGFVQRQNDRTLLQQQESAALVLHQETAQRLREMVLTERKNGDLLYLSQGQMETLFASFAARTTRSFLLSKDGKTVIATGETAVAADALLLENSATVLQVLRDPESGDAFLAAGSILFLNEEEYSLITRTELPLRGANARYALPLLLLAASTAAGLLVTFFVFLGTRSHRKLSSAMQAVTEGEYDLRLPLRGNRETKELLASYNTMAEAVEENFKELLDSSDSRKRFASSMAHEMKTPLTSILCMGDILRIKREVSEEERMELAGVIVEEAKRMRALSSKILELSSAESASIEKERLSVAALLDEVRAVETPILALRGLRLTVVGGENAYIYADRELMKSLLCNLIDNAAKASGEGKTIRLANTLRERNRKRQVLIAVADEGIGMTREEVRLATEPFYMADKARSRKAGGAGLGLALCKEIAARHDATLNIRSEKGKGTTVILRIPAMEAENSGNAGDAKAAKKPSQSDGIAHGRKERKEKKDE